MVSKDAYFPFGKRIEGLSVNAADPQARYKYNGKELDDENNLNWLAYGARYYDPELGRWHVVDPAEEYWASYNYVANNPIYYIDPYGLDTDNFNSKGDYVGTYEAKWWDPTSWKWGLFFDYWAIDGVIAGEMTTVFADHVSKEYSLPWIWMAAYELGQKSVEGPANNERVLEYLHTTGSWWSSDETAWCSAFVNWTMKYSEYGMKGTNSALASSWKKFGQKLSEPAIGSIVVFDWGNGHGHVGYLVGWNNNGNPLILGGNQGPQEVAITTFPQKPFGYYYPTGYKPKN